MFFLRVSIIILFILLPVTVAGVGTMELDFGNNGLSASIEEAPLKMVVEKIAEKNGIWIKGTENLSEELYSVEFEDVSIREALKRMLYSFNCCYFIDQEGDLLGVIIVNKKNRRSVPQRIRRARKLNRGIRRR